MNKRLILFSEGMRTIIQIVSWKRKERGLVWPWLHFIQIMITMIPDTPSKMLIVRFLVNMHVHTIQTLWDFILSITSTLMPSLILLLIQ